MNRSKHIGAILLLSLAAVAQEKQLDPQPLTESQQLRLMKKHEPVQSLQTKVTNLQVQGRDIQLQYEHALQELNAAAAEYNAEETKILVERKEEKTNQLDYTTMTSKPKVAAPKQPDAKGTVSPTETK